MTSENPRYAVDPWSRFVSYCSLVVAFGALLWALFGFGTLTNWGKTSADKSLDAAALNARYEDEVQQRNEQDQEFRNQWKQQQAEQLTAYTEAANALLREHQQLIGKLQAGGVAGASYTLTAETDAVATDTGDDATAEEADTEFAGDKLPPLPITPAPADENVADTTVEYQSLEPLLAYVRETLRPETDAHAALLTVRNRGSSPAALARVEFTPSYADDSIFEVDPSAATLAAADDQDVLSIVFSEADNLAAAAGKHGIYARELSDEHVVPAASDVRIRLAVANSKHVGWGFHGTLKLEYNGLEPLTIEDAQLVFVAADDTVRRQ